MSTKHNTLQNYVVRYIKKTLNTSSNEYDKLYRELLSKVEGIIKQAVSEAKHQDSSLESIYNNLKSNKKLLDAIAKQQISTFLNTHQIKKEVFEEFFDKHAINESDLKTLEEAKDIVNKINNINLLQQSKGNEKLNIKKTLAQSIPLKSPIIEKHKSTLSNDKVLDK